MAQAFPDNREHEPKYTYFWRSPSPFSQWHRCKFTADGQTYNCAEQYMMFHKAKLFGDDEIAAKVMTTQHPRDQKSLGRKVKNFDEQTWNDKCQEIVKEGNIAKFSQNKRLKTALLATAGTTLAEASPSDTIWGIGLAEEDPLSRDKKTWCGQNLLGYILTEVRDELMAKDPASSQGMDKTKYTFFWKTRNEFSQWYGCCFEVDGITYNCAEQYMMHKKAVLFGDDEIAGKILATEEPRKQKSLGRKVNHFNEQKWNAECEKIVKEGNMAKNKNLQDMLFATAGTVLVEASPHDKIWGIGLPESDPRALDKAQWLGRNKLGHILTEVREQLMASEDCPVSE